jgi:hypothetical protein
MREVRGGDVRQQGARRHVTAAASCEGAAVCEGGAARVRPRPLAGGNRPCTRRAGSWRAQPLVPRH